MTTAERRENILEILSEAAEPVAARDLAARFGVSRQVIVQDLAVIRASHPHIISTYRGYVMQQDGAGSIREFKVRHRPDQTEEELDLIVDHGGWVKNISISHRVYGRMTADLDIRCRQDVREFLKALRMRHPRSCPRRPTDTTIIWWRRASAGRLDQIGQALEQAGFLVPLQPWEQAASER